MLKEETIAPNFSAKNQDDKIISLADFKGKKVVLYFYPKDNTPGCTAEACDLRDNFREFRDKGFEIIGVSPDDSGKHKAFIEKHKLPFDLIADVNNQVANLFGAWGEKKAFGKTSTGILRTTFIISEEGVIEKIIKKVNTKNHSNQIFTELKINK